MAWIAIKDQHQPELTVRRIREQAKADRKKQHAKQDQLDHLKQWICKRQGKLGIVEPSAPAAGVLTRCWREWPSRRAEAPTRHREG